VEVNQIY